MRIIPLIKNLTAPEKEQFEKYLDEKLKRITPLVESHHPEADEVTVDAKIQKHKKHTAFEFEYVFELPRQRFVSREVKHTITEAMDWATDKLEKQLIKHFKRLVEG